MAAFEPRSPGKALCGFTQINPQDSTMSDLQMRVCEYRKQQTEAQKGDAYRHVKQIQREQEAVRELEDEMDAKLALAEEARKLRLEAQLVRATLAETLPAMAQSSAELACVRQRRLREEAFLQSEAASKEEHLRALVARHEKEASEIDMLLAVFTNRMGLTVAPAGPQAVSLKFTLIDAKHPEREFIATIGLCSNGSYEDLGSTPNLPHMGQLMKELNEAPHHVQGAFPHFVYSVRKGFKALC